MVRPNWKNQGLPDFLMTEGRGDQTDYNQSDDVNLVLILSLISNWPLLGFQQSREDSKGEAGLK